jgi:Recombination endonuclease VII
MRRIFSDRPLTQSERNKRYYENHKEQSLARNAQFYRDNKEAQAKRHRNTRHGITQEWFDSKLVEQDNKCAVCRKPFERTPHIDHDHKCCPKLKSCDKCRRGLLCEGCNIGLGMLQENPEILSNAIQYVNSYKKEQ